jgi:hypothetical protein
MRVHAECCVSIVHDSPLLTPVSDCAAPLLPSCPLPLDSTELQLVFSWQETSVRFLVNTDYNGYASQ